jgi:hypothetical protein
MNKSIACAFPETLPDERLLFPLVQVFEQVVYMQAVENEPVGQGSGADFILRCRQLDWLQFFTSTPLGNQRERFLALVSDLQRRGADYTSQLSMLTLAALHNRDTPESNASIVSGLLQRGDIKEQDESALLLWQSRLILKLGEIFDIEQAELNMALRRIADRESTLLADLCEEDDSPFILPVNAQDSGQETNGMLRHRLKAWSRLCFHDGNRPPGILVTRHRTAMDLMQEVFEKRCRQSARQIISLELPCAAPLSADDAIPGEPPGLHCPSLRAGLAMLTDGVTSVELEGKTMPLLSEGQAQWSQRLSDHFPEQERCHLDLFFFPGMTAGQLCAVSFDGGRFSQASQEETATGCVVGLLQAD